MEELESSDGEPVSERSWDDPEGVVHIARSGPDVAHIHVEPSAKVFVSRRDWTTRYPDDLIRSVMDAKGAAYLVDEIMRDENRDYVQRALHWGLFAFLDPDAFVGRRLLDFGCGAGSSTSILARELPKTEFVGVELEEKLLAVARMRADHYGYSDRVTFLVSPDAQSLPQVGRFDFVLFSAVFEHLLPDERDPLLELVWDTLDEGGVMFINQTPNRWSVVEYHTTSGLPLLNYLPDRAAHFYATRASKRRQQGASWDELLRAGIRGSTAKELSQRLDRFAPGEYEFLAPTLGGVTDDVELWYRSTSILDERSAKTKRLIRRVAKVSGPLNQFILPSIVLAVRKASSSVAPKSTQT